MGAIRKNCLKPLTIDVLGCNILALMSDSLPLTVDPWLMYRCNHEVVGTLPLSKMPNLQASQHRRVGEANVRIAVKQREDGQMIIAGQAEIELALECQRCLNTLVTTVSTAFELVLVKYERQLSGVSDDDDAIVCYDSLELAPLVEQELILSLPMIAKHSDCQAMYENTVSEASDRQQPFANLKDLLN